MTGSGALHVREDGQVPFEQGSLMASLLEKIADHWRRVADSLTEPARKQLLDDLRDWDAAAWEHRLHPTRSTGTTSEAACPSKGDGKNDA